MSILRTLFFIKFIAGVFPEAGSPYKQEKNFSFEFRQEITGQDGFLFSTDHQGAYFAIAINDGFLESILSPKANSRQDYDRFQRLFPNRVNDANWHRLEFTMSSDNSIGSFVLVVVFFYYFVI